MYTYKQFENTYFLSIENHQDLTEAFETFCEEQEIKVGTITGIGAVKEVTLRFFDPKTKEYEDKTFNEQMEISNLTGNITRKDGDVYLHMHITLGRKDYTALAGHLLTCIIHGAGEFVIQKIDGDVGRIYDEDCGLNLLGF